MIKPNTPVLVGIGQYSERLDDADYRALSPVQLAAEAGKRALTDALSIDALAMHVDTIAAVRTFEDSVPSLSGAFGKTNNFPRAIARPMGIDPKNAIWEVAGGQSPQHLVSEFCARIAAGEIGMGVVVGAEALSTVRDLKAKKEQVEWSETIDGSVEDRGAAIGSTLTTYMREHQLQGAPQSYGLFENARRARLGLSREEYRLQMGKLFAPFTALAAANPHSMSKRVYSAEEIAEISASNRMIADPYTRRLVARDHVNLGAAVLLTSVGKARELGIAQTQWLYLHGYADLTEQPVIERADLSRSPASILAAKTALEQANIRAGDLSLIDLYSCFPIPVFNICDGLGIAPDDPRGLTVTGGLPYFGGPGNNYSMHAICAMAQRLRAEPGSYGFVGANGGLMSKYSAAVYSTTPTNFQAVNCEALQQQIDELPRPEVAYKANGPALIETYTVIYVKGQPATAVVVGRLKATNQRFLANQQTEDRETLEAMLAEDPIGREIHVLWTPTGNRFAFEEARLRELFPLKKPGFRDRYEYIKVNRDGHLLEVVINRPEARNCLHPPANMELDDVFNAFYNDPELWVCILSGEGEAAFCAGNDLKWSAAGKPLYLPENGFGGITSRKNRNKPVIAAVNGYAMGGGLEICLACDIVVADENARMALSEVKVGLFAGAGGLVRLPRQIPRKVATDMILTGRRIGSVEAMRLGLVSRTAPAGKAVEVAREIAAELLDSSPTSVRLSMEIMNQAFAIADAEEAVTAHYTQVDELLTSEDMLEGVIAFGQKRKPQWKNR